MATVASRNVLNSAIGPGSFFEGKFYIAGSLQVDGKFEGEIRTDETLHVGQNGRIKTNIRAKDVIVEGTMIGNINARNSVRLEPTGKVLGDIAAPTVYVAPGVVAKGSINITGSGKKNANSLVEDAYQGGSSVQSSSASGPASASGEKKGKKK